MPDARELIEDGYAALNRGEMPAAFERITDDFIWEEGERSLGAGVHHGRASFEEFLRSWLESFDDFRIELIEVLEHGDDVVVVGRQSGRGAGSGLPVEIDVVHVWTVRDGHAVRWRSFPNRDAAIAALG